MKKLLLSAIGGLFFYTAIFIFLCNLLTVNCFAQYQWNIYTIYNSGLYCDVIDKVVFDTNNVKWIATCKGVAKFNGTTWVVYDTSNSPLRSTNIQDLAFENNLLWIATLGGYR